MTSRNLAHQRLSGNRAGLPESALKMHKSVKPGLRVRMWSISVYLSFVLPRRLQLSVDGARHPPGFDLTFGGRLAGSVVHVIPVGLVRSVCGDMARPASSAPPDARARRRANQCWVDHDLPARP